MIRKILIWTKAILPGISYTIKSNYSRYMAIKALKKRMLRLKRNPWVEYIAGHTPMNYYDAFEIYYFYCLHVVSTPKAAKSFTNLIMDMASCGFGVSDIKLCLYVAHEELKAEACVVVMHKVEKRKV